ncbi:L-serine ammonia-lyase [Alysiella filiformis]|uniref:L-serine dehydratase n=1 Tax=Alysiella filiformis DSM 16848 TaxID=1120981 RepID=A0A286EJC9_9NEIS|nr:L-serine ammonia-lyase [Alysiella filiformis]QMT30715.1 L-serine ammonia-lyase [Alysiella filiformis]UBQ56306.1 L-serine ammonia-lyase [Alysiella filiformis DSM 16848]SOD71008.1 L-serine ammonia-lyase [Alysiella filiformis DSM 16848]
MLSIFDIFKIGLGPSSSHTVGPMKAAAAFAGSLNDLGVLPQVKRLAAEVYGSLALTGLGHGTFDAILLGLEGSLPHNVDLETLPERLEHINAHAQLQLNGTQTIDFEVARDMVVRYSDSLPKHPNGLRFIAYDAQEQILHEQIYYSIGGGFIVTDEQFGKEQSNATSVPYPFKHMADLLRICDEEDLSIAQVVVQNEAAISGEKPLAVRRRVAAIAQAMFDCVERGLQQRGVLAGGLNVQRRAPDLAVKMQNLREAGQLNTHLWPMIYAMAVNEENAAGGRVVTAPTNGAAGIVPAVLYYFHKFHPLAAPRAIEDFLLVAGAIGILYKTNASISGAEVGCQGEVGVACSMAAGAFSAVSGGTTAQIENAAEMAMEHHLGLTCDPVGGLVQIPCIERNGIAAEKAIKLAQLSLLEDGNNKKVSLDMVIKTMLQTGLDMKSTYKETSLAGLAVTLKKKAIPISVRVVEC